MTKAATYFKKGVDYEGDHFFKEEAHYRYGVFLLSQKQFAEAKKQFDLL